MDKLKWNSISFRGTGKRQRVKGAGVGGADVLVRLLGELDNSGL